MKGALIIIFLTILAVTLAQQPFWVTTLKAKCQSSGEKSSCLGAIISDDCLITAASCFSHCAQNDSLSIKATALQYSTSGKSMRIKVVKDGITIHPDYATSQAADLALVKFETPKFVLAKATISDNCKQINKADDLSVINVINEKTITTSPIQKDVNKKCKDIYKPNWQGSTQTCFNTSACAEKPGSFIEDDNTLYAMTTFGCMQGSNTIAALLICKYYEWINDHFTTPTGKINTGGKIMSFLVYSMCSNIWLHCGLMTSFKESHLYICCNWLVIANNLAYETFILLTFPFLWLIK